MSLIHGIVNLLNVNGLRRVEHCPPHFVRVVFDIRTSEKTISDWIYENLDGRFYFGNWYEEVEVDGQTKVVLSKCAAFEIPHEASFFSLQLSEFNQNSNQLW